MNETESVERANAFITSIEAFAAAHPFVTAWLAAWLLSWFATAMFKRPINALMPQSWDAWGVRLFDVVIAGAASAWLLMLLHIPLAWLVVAAAIIGLSSPSGYWAVTGLVGWKWPAAKRFFTLRELALSDGDDASSDADPPVPPTSPTP